jgi:phosphatidate cytidylyltransferase
MQTRIISAIVALIAFIVVLFLGPVAIRVALIFLTLLGIYELKRMIGNNFNLDFIATALVVALAFFTVLDQALALIFLYLLFCLIMSMIQKGVDFRGFIGNAFSTAYVAIPMFLLMRAILFSPVNLAYLLIFIIAWGTDTIAYFAGSFFGQRPLAPITSPKKTWEGAIGGTIGALILSLIFGLLVLDGVDLIALVVFSIVGSIVSQLGDVAISHLKRATGIKDSGVFLPGHGGLLDRFDSLFAVTAVYYLFILWLF